MTSKNVVYPEIVPIDFYQWIKKNFRNEDESPIKVVDFRSRRRAPNLRLKRENYSFDIEVLKAKKKYRNSKVSINQVVKSIVFKNLLAKI